MGDGAPDVLQGETLVEMHRSREPRHEFVGRLGEPTAPHAFFSAFGAIVHVLQGLAWGGDRWESRWIGQYSNGLSGQWPSCPRCGTRPVVRAANRQRTRQRETAVLVRIATRRSPLALWQASHVAHGLRTMHADIEVATVGIVTEGDRNQSPSLAAAGGKGLFVNSLEAALAEDRADIAVHSMKDVPDMVSGTSFIAVHSMKDVPGTMSARFTLTTFGARADPRDALVARQGHGLLDLPAGAVVGTSSGRRQAVLRHLRRDLELQPLRGNVDTRLAKLDAGECDAIVVACAGLDRLGHAERITERLAVELMTPAPGQGVLAVEHLAERDDIVALLAPGTLPAVEVCATAERTVASALGADCTLPLGVHCVPAPDGFVLHATLLNAEGERELRLRMQGESAAVLAQEAGRRLSRLNAAAAPVPAGREANHQRARKGAPRA